MSDDDNNDDDVDDDDDDDDDESYLKRQSGGASCVYIGAGIWYRVVTFVECIYARLSEYSTV